MSGEDLKRERRRRGWTQKEAASKLGVSQSYLSMLEGGARAVPPRLAKKMVRAYDLPATFLPASVRVPQPVDRETLARQLGALGYAGFAYRGRRQQQRNPAEILVEALMQKDLDARLVEALPWLLYRYPNLDRDWLVQQARLHNLQNRLGFVTNLARRVAEKKRDFSKEELERLAELERRMDESRLAREDTLCQDSLTEAERRWLRENRPAEAEYWNLLTDWRPELLRYANAG